MIKKRIAGEKLSDEEEKMVKDLEKAFLNDLKRLGLDVDEGRAMGLLKADYRELRLFRDVSLGTKLYAGFMALVEGKWDHAYGLTILRIYVYNRDELFEQLKNTPNTAYDNLGEVERKEGRRVKLVGADQLTRIRRYLRTAPSAEPNDERLREPLLKLREIVKRLLEQEPRVTPLEEAYKEFGIEPRRKSKDEEKSEGEKKRKAVVLKGNDIGAIITYGEIGGIFFYVLKAERVYTLDGKEEKKWDYYREIPDKIEEIAKKEIDKLGDKKPKDTAAILGGLATDISYAVRKHTDIPHDSENRRLEMTTTDLSQAIAYAFVLGEPNINVRNHYSLTKEGLKPFLELFWNPEIGDRALEEAERWIDAVLNKINEYLNGEKKERLKTVCDNPEACLNKLKQLLIDLKMGKYRDAYDVKRTILPWVYAIAADEREFHRFLLTAVWGDGTVTWKKSDYQ